MTAWPVELHPDFAAPDPEPVEVEGEPVTDRSYLDEPTAPAPGPEDDDGPAFVHPAERAQAWADDAARRQRELDRPPPILAVAARETGFGPDGDERIPGAGRKLDRVLTDADNALLAAITSTSDPADVEYMRRLRAEVRQRQAPGRDRDATLRLLDRKLAGDDALRRLSYDRRVEELRAEHAATQARVDAERRTLAAVRAAEEDARSRREELDREMRDELGVHPADWRGAPARQRVRARYAERRAALDAEAVAAVAQIREAAARPPAGRPQRQTAGGGWAGA